MLVLMGRRPSSLSRFCRDELALNGLEGVRILIFLGYESSIWGATIELGKESLSLSPCRPHLFLHHLPQCCIDASLIAPAVFFEPGQHVSINPHRDWLFQRTVKLQRHSQWQVQPLLSRQSRGWPFPLPRRSPPCGKLSAF